MLSALTRPIVVLTVVLAVVACDRDAPAAPNVPESAAPVPVLDRATVAGLMIALQDLQTRIVPTFGAAPATTLLADALANVEASLQDSAGRAVMLDAALAHAETTAGILRNDSTFAADIDVVLLFLERAHAARAAAESTAAPEYPADRPVADPPVEE
jgi:hypothetical protein